MGGDMYQRSLDNKRRKEIDAREAEAHRASMEIKGLQIGALRREDATQNELRGLRTGMADFMTGTDRAATNANLDADFEQAYQATAQGLPMPAMRGGSNLENEQALTVRRPVDVSSPDFQQGMTGLRARYALASGNMADFDNVKAAERTRVASSEDAEWARAVVSDPNGEQAVQARTFINDSSRSLAIDPPDPKTGMSTLRIIRGDRTKPVDLSPSDLARVAVGVRRLQRGDVGGLDVISAVNKDLAAAAASEFNIDMQVAGENNNTAFRAAGLANDRARLGIAQAGLRLQQNQAGRPNWQQFVGADGQPVMVDLNSVRSEGGVAQLPEGVRLPRMPETLSDAEKVAYQEAVKLIAMLPENAPPGASADIFRRFGLNPERFTGNPGLPTSARFGGGTNPPPAPTPAPTPAPAQELGLQRPGTRGEAAANIRMHQELNRQFEALPETQALMQQIADLRSLPWGARGGSQATELVGQLNAMRRDFIRQNMPQ
ncbi:MAG: hypothetical protein B7Z13_03760 [Caulobacterales bacterium 32-67-6]|nr:MAG: hypothetical protein B7Z13_03760 [Caulobacterales bacterium 32-67-6]